MILIEKDRHMKQEEPFFSAQVDYNNWFCEQDFDATGTDFISLGDWFHKSHPTPEEIDESIRFFNKSKIDTFYILSGNHDWSGVMKQYSILPFQNLSNVVVICEPCVKTIQGHTFAFLPHYKNIKTMRELYTHLSDEYINAEYVCYHFEDETQHNGIDISYLKGKRLGGHIHTQAKNYELLMPITSRYDERGLKNGLYSLLEGVTIPAPNLIDYADVVYGEDLPEAKAKYTMYNIKDAPSKKLAIEKYPNTYIHDIFVVNKKREKIANYIEEKQTSQLEFFNNYIHDRDDLEKETLQRLRQIIQAKE